MVSYPLFHVYPGVPGLWQWRRVHNPVKGGGDQGSLLLKLQVDPLLQPAPGGGRARGRFIGGGGGQGDHSTTGPTVDWRLSELHPLLHPPEE